MKSLIGKVLSAKTAKTVTVGFSSSHKAPLYQKILRRVIKFHAHDELGAKEGDRVKIVETRPLSRTKFWRVTEIVSRAKTAKVFLPSAQEEEDSLVSPDSAPAAKKIEKKIKKTKVSPKAKK